MKKRKILVLFPFLGLLLSGCTLQEALGNVKDWTTGHVLDPIKNLINGGEKEEQQDEDEHKEDEGGETEVTIRYIELEDYPHEVIQNKVIEPKDVSIKVVYSDQTDKTEHPEEVICDTSKVGETELVAKYKGEECIGKVTVKEAPVTEHAGTEEDPFTGKDAVTIAQSLQESSKDDKHPSEQSYYIKGVVGALLEEFNPSFGNFTFTIEENFEGYRLKFGPNYTAFKNATDLEVGDTVTMYAQILNFKGTYETSGGYITKIEKPAIEANLTEITIEGNPQTTYLAGTAYNHDGLSVIAHYDNGETQDVTLAADWEISKETAELGDETVTISATYLEFGASMAITVTVQDSSNPTHAGTEEDPYDGFDAVIVAGKLASGQATEASYYIKGKVINFEENFNPSYGNYSFKIEGGFIGWRLKNGPEYAAFEEGDLQVGDTVTMYAQIQAYGNDCKPETKGGYVVSIDRPIVDVESVSLDKNELNMEVGMPDETLVATVLPENATNKAVEWVSANPEVATVNDGVVHAVAAGETTVTVKSVADPTKSATCSVTVSEQTKELVSVQIKTMPKVEYTEGDKLDLSDLVLTLYYDDNSTQDVTTGYTTNIALDHELTTDDTELIITYGEFALQPITLTIAAKPQPTHAGTAEDPYTVEDAFIALDNGGNVKEVYATGIVSKIVTAYNTQYSNITFDISADGTTEGHQLRGYRTSGADAGNVEVGDTVILKGDLTIYNSTYEFTSGNLLIQLTKKVYEVESVTLDQHEASMQVSLADLSLTATVLPEKASQELEWTSSNEEVATVENGVVHAVGAGEATIKAQSVDYPEMFDECVVSVTVPEKSVVGVAVSSMPKVEYNLGEKLDLSNLVLTISYNDESQEEVATGYTTNIALDHELTAEDTSLVITYAGVSADPIALTINVPEAIIAQGVYYITATEENVTYYLKSNGTTAAPSAVTDSTQATQFTFTLVEGKTDEYEIKAGDSYLYSTDTNNGVRIGSTAATWKIEKGSREGGGFDMSTVTGSKTRFLSLYNKADFRGYDSATASNRHVNTNVEVPVVKTLQSITVEGPTKVDYEVGQQLNTEGLVVTAHYLVGEEIEDRVLASNEYSLSQQGAFTENDLGDKTITVTFGDKSAEFVVHITESTTPPSEETKVEFTLGENGSASHADGTGATTYSETVQGYTLSLKDGVKMYSGAIDAKGNGCLKFGTSSAGGSFNIDLSSVTGVKKVIILAAQYKSNSDCAITVGSNAAVTLTSKSNDGAYDEIEYEVGSSTSVSVSFSKRAMMNGIIFVF